MGRKRSFLGFLATLFMAFFTANAFAEGYTCPTYKQYSSCNAGYYMVGSSSSTTHNGTATTGNACIACSNAGTGCVCSGGTAEPVCIISVTCEKGTYIAKGATTCGLCDRSGYYCPGGTYTFPAAGAPEDIIAWIDVPSLDLITCLMQSVDLILATGGPGMVKSAYSSGKPALGVGAGNTPAIIDESADIILAVNSIIHSKTFDNGMICGQHL